MQSFLDDIRQLSARGEHEDALELVELWLEEHPGDTEARLLKAEACLAAGKNHAYVGQLLQDAVQENDERFDALRQQSVELAWNLIAEGRDQLRRRYPGDALDRFNAAVALVSTDAVIPLAAGLALLRANPTQDSDTFSAFENSRRRLSPAALAAEIERYLRLVIAQTQPDERPYEVAVTALVKSQLANDRLMPEALALLASIAHPTPSTLELSTTLNERVVSLALETVASLLRMGLLEKADALIETCSRAGVTSSRFALYRAESRADQTRRALTAYKRALRRVTVTPLSPDAGRTVLVAVQGIQVTCPQCGKSTPPNAPTCAYCDTPLAQRRLMIDDYPDAPDPVLAHAGIAELLTQQGVLDQALEHCQIAIDLLPPDHPVLKTLRELYNCIAHADEPPADAPVFPALRAVAKGGLSADALRQIRRVNEHTPDAWFTVPIRERGVVVRRLIDAGHLKLARETLALACADKPERKLVVVLRQRLERAVAQHIEATLDEAHALIAAERAEAVVALASEALELHPDARLYRLRGEARLALAYDLAALDDFHSAAQHAREEGERAMALRAAALVLERRWNIAGAWAILNQLNPADADVRRAGARLERRERGEPVVLTERVADGVMEDSLTRRALPPYTHGYFAVAVREVGFSGAGGEVWAHRLLSAGYEFVQVLGALRDVMGDAVFALRTISRPHRQIPERGGVTVALLVRVSAQDEAQCRARALQLWTDIHTILPLAQENVYVFEPVVDEDELQALLTPFEPVHAAEIARREFESEGVYTVSPFTPGTLDLHNLHWVLLRQSAPAMLSLHLKPTNLLPWERSTTLDRPPTETGDEYALLESVTPGALPMDRHLALVQLWEKLQMRRAQLNRLDAAYLLRVYVAGSAGTSQLLPEMAAAALFGSVREQSGGCEIVRVGDAKAFDVIRRNLATLDVESPLLSAGRFRYLVGESEAAQVFRLPIPNAEGIPGMAMLEGKPVVPPIGMPEGGARLGVSVARIKGVPHPITQSEDDRRRHLYVVGKTGMGKSTLLMSLILQDIEAGRGVFLLDPHGDLCDDVLARIPASRADDVILLDPSDAERPVGLNILDAETEADQHRIVNEFIGMLMRLYDPHNQAIVGPIFQQTVRNAMLAAMSLPDGTLIDVYRLLTDDQYVKRVLPYIRDPLVKNYWEDIAARVERNASDRWKAEMLPYLVSKFSRFVEDSTLRRMIGQPRTSIEWGRAMDEGKILLVNLAKGRIGQENAQFIGSLVLSSVLQAAFRRGEIPAARRREFYLYIDEVQNYATPMLATMLSEGRKFGVVLTIANQFLHQLDHGIREAVFGNVGSLVAFRVGTQDAPALAPEFYPVFSPGDLLNLPQFTACVKLLIDGVAARPFTMRTLPAMTSADAVLASRIREASRQRYGTDIASVQHEILRKF